MKNYKNRPKLAFLKTKYIYFVFLFSTSLPSAQGAGSEVKNKNQAQEYIGSLLPKNFVETGFKHVTQPYSINYAKKTPLAQFWAKKGKPIDFQKIWENEKAKNPKESALDKNQKIAGWQILKLAGLDKVVFFCREIIYKHKFRTQASSKSYNLKQEQEKLKAEKELVEQKQALEKLKSAGLKERTTQNTLFALYLIIYIVGGGSALGLLLFFFYGYLLPFFRLIAPKKTIKILNYTNLKGLKYKNLPRIPKSLPTPFYNEIEETKLSKERISILHFAKSPKNIANHLLLYGPPGTGKTLFSKRVARDAKVPYFHTSGSNLARFKKKGGEVKHQFLLLLQQAKKQKKAIIIIDEVDQIDAEDIKTIQGEFESRLTNQVLLIFITNNIEKVPEATQERMKMIFVGLPNEQTTKEIIAHNLDKQGKTFKVRTNFADEAIEDLASQFSERKASARIIADAITSAIANAKQTKSKLLPGDIIMEISDFAPKKETLQTAPQEEEAKKKAEAKKTSKFRRYGRK